MKRVIGADMTDKDSVIYIIGAISLDKDYFGKFKKAEEDLRLKGYDKIINPCCLPDNLPYRKYAPISIAFVETCDILFVLNNADNSIGAQAEIAYAKMSGKTIIYQGETK